MSDDKHRTIGERYGSATEATSLKVGPERGAADYLIAAGWLRHHHAGAVMFRLAREYDAVKGEHGIAQTEFDRCEREACETEREGLRMVGPMPKGQGYAERVEEIRKSASAQALTSRAMILAHMKSLNAAVDALNRIAGAAVEGAGLEWPPHVIRAIVGQVLDVHLDPTCHHCQGRGSNGGYGTPQMICRECRGSARRSAADVGKDGVQREFAAWLLAEMRRLLGVAGAGIGRAMGDSVRDDQHVETVRQELGERLAAMRSPQAQQD